MVQLVATRFIFKSRTCIVPLIVLHVVLRTDVYLLEGLNSGHPHLFSCSLSYYVGMTKTATIFLNL